MFWTDGQYFGPAAIVNAHRFIFDSRDDGAEVRLDILNDKEGVWRCRTTFNCTEACPRGIEVTKAIAEVKQAILRGRCLPVAPGSLSEDGAPATTETKRGLLREAAFRLAPPASVLARRPSNTTRSLG